jgi:hypothetical protein
LTHAAVRAKQRSTSGEAPAGVPSAAHIAGAITMLKTSKSKNDPTARGPAQQVKSFEGKKVKPVLYVGTAVGHGRYIAGQDESGKMILDRGGKPIPYRLI